MMAVTKEYVIRPWFSSQFHPEACSGPVDTEFMFDKFIEVLNNGGHLEFNEFSSTEDVK